MQHYGSGRPELFRSSNSYYVMDNIEILKNTPTTIKYEKIVK